MKLSRLLPVVTAFLACSASAALAGDSWPQFRGPTGQGVSDATGLPVEWSEDENVTWKTPIHGRAWSSPVVLGNQIWLTTATPDGRKLSVLCVDKDSGKVVHDLKLFDVEKPQYAHPFNSYASPTPALEAGRVYVSFGSPGIACLDAATGKVIWERRDFICNHFRGAGSSPLLYNDLVILPFDGSDFQYVAAMDKTTGQTRWKTDRSIDFQDLENGKPQADGDWRKAFSTPRISTLTGEPLVISLGSKAVYAYEPSTGAEVWRLEERGSHSGSSTPVIGDEFIYATSGFGNEKLRAIKPGGKGVLTEDHVAWTVNKNVPQKPSPVLVEGRLYMVDDAGIASCVDARTGNAIWSGRLKGNYSAAPVYADGKIYFCNEDDDAGLTTVIKAGTDKLEVLTENELETGFMASPAVVDDALILRSKTHLYRIELKK